jgi:sodium/potassium-transporting ATPase subunit alpha
LPILPVSNINFNKEIDRFVKILVVIAVVLGIIFFAVGFVVKMNWIHNIIYTIGIIIANVPEGLLPTVTVSNIHWETF